jgi:hypothetical protein
MYQNSLQQQEQNKESLADVAASFLSFEEDVSGLQTGGNAKRDVSMT